MINIFEKYNKLTDEERKDIEDLYIVHQLYKQLENSDEVDLTKLEYKILFNKVKECFNVSNIDVREIIKRIIEILKCVDKTISDIDDLELEELVDLISNKDSDFKTIEHKKDILFAITTARFYCLLLKYEGQYMLVCEKNDGTQYQRRFKNEFDSILKDLSDLGYNNYWQVLNAKDYGIPQNRERVFIISIRKDIDNGKFTFPETIPLQLKLKDLLEDVVDDKYYLTEKGIGRLIKKNNKLIRNNDNPDVSSCIIAGYYKMDGRNNQYISEQNKPKRIGGIYDTEERKRQAGSIYDSNAISPTLTTMFPGGDKQPFVLVNEGTKKGTSEAREGDSINISYPNNMRKRGRVGKEVSQTILTSPNMAVVENANKPICLNANKNVSIQDRIYDEEGISTTVTASEFKPKIAERKMFNPYNDKEIKDIAPTQTANCGNSYSSAAVLISEDGTTFMRIRKLTPLECWRLMGFDDKDFYKAKDSGISDTQLYRQAGNSIVVNVLEKIIEGLLK